MNTEDKNTLETSTNEENELDKDLDEELESNEPSPTPNPDDDDETAGTFSEEDEDEIENLKKELNMRKLSLQQKLKSSLIMRQKIQEELNEIQEQLDLLGLPILSPSEKTIKPVIPSELVAGPPLASALKEINFKGTARRGAMSRKEKEELVEIAEKKKKEEHQIAGGQPIAKPGRPIRPGEKPLNPQQPMTPEQKKEFITNKLKQRDPRQQKEGFEFLKKPENKGLLPELMKDKEFEKLYKSAEKTVAKYDDIKNTMRKSLKTLMRSSSDVVKLQVSKLRSGKIGSAVSGLKEISNAVNFDNEVGKAAGNVVKGVQELYKMFGIKPEEALNKELLDEAKPVFTHQMAEKGKYDREIDVKSRQNRLWGETKEITDEEKELLKKISKTTGSDKLPSVKKKEDMKLVKELIVDIAKNPNGKIPLTALVSKGNEK